MPKTSELQKVTFRIPKDLYATVQALAGEETRPINSQVIVLLREAVAARHQQSAKASEKPGTQRVPAARA